MEPTSKEQPAGEEIAQLEKEIDELEKIVKQEGEEGMRTMRAGCWPLILTTTAALVFLLLPQPIPTGSAVALTVIGGIGTIFLIRFAIKSIKQAKSPQQNKKATEILTQLDEKSKRLKALKKSG